MSVKAGKLAKLLASRNYQQQYQSEYHSPKFYTSKGHVGGHKKNDQEIFDFTDSRLIRPPLENISNKPLAKHQETFKTFHTPSVDASNTFFDEHFNKYHPILPQRMENNVHQEEGYHYSKPVNHYKKPVVDHQPYSVSNFEPEFFKQFYDETEKHFLPVRTNTNHALRKSTILKNKEPKKFAFPTFETF